MKTKLYNQLLLLAEPKYQSFSQKLLPGVENILGVRLPILRKIAKEIAKGEVNEYFQWASDETFEEVMIQGMVIGYLDQDFKEVQVIIREFLPKISNWSVCDSFCMGLKITERHPKEMWEFLQEFSAAEHEYSVRFAVVMLLRFYINIDYIEQSLVLLDKVQHGGYYAKMAVAWAVSVCFVKFPEQTTAYLYKNNLDDFTYNKALQKITESSVVSKDTKNWIRKLKR